MSFEKGHKHSKEALEKISKSSKGRTPWNKDKKNVYSDETKRKISETLKSKNIIPPSRKGVKYSIEELSKIKRLTGDKHPMWKGGQVCIECGEKCSVRGKRCMKCGIKLRTGENNYKWKGGVSTENHKIRHSVEYKLWRKSVFERDNYTCVWCGIKNCTFNADHINPFSLYPELRFAIDNGRTLCVPCHKTTDTYGGKLKFIIK